ncbi:MAG: type II toxin-antitoxin system HipA family toxin, partial [Gammaproteobacteria bacterium]
AIDGHAKKFSVLIEPEGRFPLTPLYDVLSAYPFMGNRNGQLSPQKTKMAMAVIGENRHYRWQTILRHHWQSTAAHADFASEIEGVITELVEQTPRVLDEIANILPADFPDNVAAPILEGLGNAVTALTA